MSNPAPPLTPQGKVCNFVDVRNIQTRKELFQEFIGAKLRTVTQNGGWGWFKTFPEGATGRGAGRATAPHPAGDSWHGAPFPSTIRVRTCSSYPPDRRLPRGDSAREPAFPWP